MQFSSKTSASSDTSEFSHLKKCPQNLKELLLEISEFNSKRSLIPFYTKIENEKQKRKQTEFWECILPTIIENYLKSSIFTGNQLKEIFILDKFIPLGFETVLKEICNYQKKHQQIIIKNIKNNEQEIL